MMFALFMMIVAYLVGSIPSGFIIARACGIDDIRSHGSGNIGATNVARLLGIKYFFVVLLLDCLKAFTFLKIAGWYGMSDLLLLILAAALLIGNIASVFLTFRGGKGIATLVGIFLALEPLLVLYVLGIWLAVLLLTRTVGVSSVAALVALPACAMLIYGINFFFLFSCLVSALALYRHRDNIIQFAKSCGCL